MSTNLILIDSNLKDTDVLLSALNAQTIGILYNYDTSRNTILQKIEGEFSGESVSRVAICCHGGVNRFLENGKFFDLDSSTNEVLKNENTHFILDLLKTYNVSNIDFLACNSLKYDSWRKFYDLIENEVEGVTVGASEDETGNLKYGGNWVMENTGEQVDNIYFNGRLEYYKFLFYTQIGRVQYTGHNVTGWDTNLSDNRGTLITSLTIEEFVGGNEIREINTGVFSDKLDGSELLTLPKSILIINYNAFNATAMVFKLPYKIEYIGNNCFSRLWWEYHTNDWSNINNYYRVYNTLWANITAIRIPRTCQYIGQYAFQLTLIDHIIFEIDKNDPPYYMNNYYDMNLQQGKPYTVYIVYNKNMYSKYFNLTRTVKDVKSDFSTSNWALLERNITNVTLETNTITEKNVNISVRISVNNPCYNIGHFISFEHSNPTFNSNMISVGEFEPFENDQMNKEWIGYISTSQEINYENIKLKINSTNDFETTFTVYTIPPPTLDFFQIDPTDITVENHGTINMTFSDDRITLVDISNSLTVDPSNVGIIDNINESSIGSNNWTAIMIPNSGLKLIDCSLNFKHNELGIDETRIFNIDSTFEVIDFSLTPSNLVDSDVSATLRIESDKSLSSPNLNNFIQIDPSYIATLGQMSDVSGGFVWEGVLTRTPNMNKLGNKLDLSYNGTEITANLVFDVVENSELRKQKLSLTNSDIVNKGFTNTLQMSPNGLLMGFIDGSNVEIYRKVDTSYTWNHDVSYNGHSFALTNNNVAIASDVSLQIYDYSGSSWNIMNGGNITYSNVVALSINVDGTYVAVSNNTDVKIYKFVDPNWIHYSLFSNENVKGLSLSPNGLKLGMGIGNVGENFSSILVEDVVDTRDIFQLADMFSLFSPYRSSHSTLQTATKTNGPSYLQGDYTVSCSSYRGDNTIKWFDSLFSGLGQADHGLFFEFILGTQIFNHHIYGDGVSKPSGGLTDFGFTEYNLTNGTDLISMNYFDTITTAGTKTGEWIQIDLPYYIKPSKFTQRNNFTGLRIGWTQTHLAATNDTNGTWEYLGVMTNQYGQGTHSIENINSPSSYGYRHYRVIVDDVHGNRGFMENIFLYGDIYNIV